MRFTTSLPAVVAALLLAPAAFALPVVSNVASVQESNGSGNTRVRVTYDLTTPVGPATVSLQYSTDGGATFANTATSVTGDVGSGITTGTGRTINWAVATDLPGQTLNNFALRVRATDSATTLAITNHGFEADPQPAATLTLAVPPGWSVYNPSVFVGNNNVGTLNPNASTHFNSVPQGSNVGLVYLEHAPDGEGGLFQTLGSTLAANSIYTLTTSIGNITSGTDNFGFFNLDGFPGYRVDLLAGGTIIASDNNTLGASIPEGEWGTSTFSLAVGASHPQLGQALGVRLVNLDNPGTMTVPNIEVDFDDVRLTVAGRGDSAAQTVETVPPHISALSALTSQSLQVTYSEPMAGSGPSTAANYAVSGTGAGTLAANPTGVAGGPSNYTLTWPSGGQLNGQPVTITASGTIQDAQGNPLPINGTANTETATALPVALSTFKLE